MEEFLPVEAILYILEVGGWKDSGLLAQTSFKFIRILTEKDVLEKIVTSCTTSVPKWLTHPLPFYYLIDKLPDLPDLCGIDIGFPQEVGIYCRNKWCVVGPSVLNNLLNKPIKKITIYANREENKTVGGYDIQATQTKPYYNIMRMSLSVLQLGYDQQQFYLTPLFMYTWYTKIVIVLPKEEIQEKVGLHMYKKHIGYYDKCHKCNQLFDSWNHFMCYHRHELPGFEFRYVVPEFIPTILPLGARTQGGPIFLD